MRLCLFLIAGLAGLNAPTNADWLGFRGDGSSIAECTAPLDWSIEDGRNVAWQADLPGRGVSGPIVVDGRVFVTASDGPNRERLHTLCVDAASGKPVWSRQVWATGRSNCYKTSAVAAPTPVSDGERIFAFFSSNDLVAIGLDGDVQWIRGLTLDHPRVGNDVGMASSPVVAGNAVVLQAECFGDSFAIAVDRKTGETLWQVERPQKSNWASPLAWTTSDGRAAVWLQDRSGAALHDAQTGEQLARIDTGCPAISSPTLADEETLVLATGGLSLFRAPFDQAASQAEKLRPASPSAVVLGSQAYVINGSGVLVCGDVTTGQMQWRKRLGGKFWATPIVVGEHLYAVNDKGETTVLDLAKRGEVVSKPAFGEDILGSPAASGGALYFRSNAHLWKIAAPSQAAATRPTSR